MNDAAESALIVATTRFEIAYCEPSKFGNIPGSDDIAWITLLLDTSTEHAARKALFGADDSVPKILVGYDLLEHLPSRCESPVASELVSFPATYAGIEVVYRRVNVKMLHAFEERKRSA